MFANRWNSNDCRRDEKILGDPLDDFELLVVLASEERGAWSGHVEEFGDDGGDAFEVAWSMGAAECRRKCSDPNARFVARRVHLTWWWSEDTNRSGVEALLNIAVEVARVAIKVFVGTKLRWVDEDGHDHKRGVFPSLGDQCLVSLVERTHGWYEADPFATASGFIAGMTEGVRRAPDVHGSPN